MKIACIGNLGYVGSALQPYLEAQGHEVFGWDIGWYNNNKVDQPYVDALPSNPIYLSFNAIRKMDAVILLAGHSSVAMCNDLYSTLQRNVFAATRLMEEIQGTPIKFIYISSASVYGMNNSPLPSNEYDLLPEPVNNYDLSKQLLDRVAQATNLDYYGLRLGTVNGWSSSIRLDLMLNSMVYSAITEKKVKVANPFTPRSILGIQDLVRAIQAILVGPKAPGIYNLSSFNSRIIDMANYVAGYCDAELEELPPSPTYSFCLNTKKFTEVFGFEFNQDESTITAGLYEHRSRLKLISDLGLQDNYKRLAR